MEEPKKALQVGGHPKHRPRLVSGGTEGVSLSGTVGVKASLPGREVCLPMSWSVGFKQIVCMKVWT